MIARGWRCKAIFSVGFAFHFPTVPQAAATDILITNTQALYLT
jgi:hypothetical protein